MLQTVPIIYHIIPTTKRNDRSLALTPTQICERARSEQTRQRLRRLAGRPNMSKKFLMPPRVVLPVVVTVCVSSSFCVFGAFCIAVHTIETYFSWYREVCRSRSYIHWSLAVIFVTDRNARVKLYFVMCWKQIYTGAQRENFYIQVKNRSSQLTAQWTIIGLCIESVKVYRKCITREKPRTLFHCERILWNIFDKEIE